MASLDRVASPGAEPTPSEVLAIPGAGLNRITNDSLRVNHFGDRLAVAAQVVHPEVMRRPEGHKPHRTGCAQCYRTPRTGPQPRSFTVIRSA